MYFPVNVEESEGLNLSEQYKIGVHFPIFILATNAGEEIIRWTGYTTASRFVQSLRKGLADLTTIDERIRRSKKQPALKDVLFLAKYYSDIGEYLTAIDYYRQARSLSGGVNNYDYKIFENYANASWNNMIEFEEVLPAADAILDSKKKNTDEIVKVAKIISRLGRKKDETDQLEKYLQAGIEATKGSRNKKLQESYKLLLTDKVLYVNMDTARAIDMKKADLGINWQNDPDKFYGFAKWCLERKINLEEAENHTRRAVQIAGEGKFKAKVLSTLAEICYIQDRIDEAIVLMEQAVEEDPGNVSLTKNMEEYLDNSGN